MLLTINEIKSIYREAKNKKREVIILSDMLECTISDVVELLRLNGVECEDVKYKRGAYKITSGRTKISREEKEHIIAMYESGMSAAQIVACTGRARSAIYQHLSGLIRKGV